MQRRGQPLTRRNFVSRTFTVLSLSPFTSGVLDFSPATDVLDVLLSALRGLEHVEAIGDAYLAHQPDFDPHARGAELRQRLITAAAGNPTLSEAVRAVIEDDFRTGRAVMLGGWVISLTEAEICALACPTHSIV